LATDISEDIFCGLSHISIRHTKRAYTGGLSM
jgi:hypothetical protein